MAQEMEGLISRRGGDSSLELSPSVVYIEACENYQKQSYRNRCRFYAADGVQALSFPIVHESGTHKLPISQIKVDYSTPWIQQHKRAIISAYSNPLTTIISRIFNEDSLSLRRLFSNWTSL